MKAIVRSWWGGLWKEWIKPILVILLIVTSIRSSLADWNDVPTGSMRPTIFEGDRVWANKLAYDLKIPYTTWKLAQWGNPSRGEIIICYSPEDGIRLVKRVIGVPGDKISMVNNQLWINGKPMKYDFQPSNSRQINGASLFKGEVCIKEELAGDNHLMLIQPAIPAARTFSEVTVPDNQYFVMGDNRDNSKDSRFFGFVRRNQILGRAQAVVLSFDRERYYCPRWVRFFRSLH